MRLAAGLSPDPLGELKRSPRPLSRNCGVPTSKGRGKGREREKGREKGRREGEEGKGRGGREGEGRVASHTIFRPWLDDDRTGFIESELSDITTS